MSQNNILAASEKIGIEARSFLESDLGKYISGCAMQDSEVAKDELMILDPYTFNTLAELQNKISSLQLKAWLAKSLTQYLSEAIDNGKQASYQLENEENE